MASISFDESAAFDIHSAAMGKRDTVDRDRGERIKYVRKQLLGLSSQERLAEVLAQETGTTLTRGAVGNWELGKDVHVDHLKALADLANISLEWLAFNDGERPIKGAIRAAPRSEEEKNKVPLVGYVRAGSAAHFYASADNPLDWVPPISDGNDDTVAVQVQGESLGALFDSWLVYYDEVRSPVTPDLIGQLCVVGLPDDRVVVKKIRRSKTRGLYDLISNTGQDDIEAVEIVWAARVKHLVPR